MKICPMNSIHLMNRIHWYIDSIVYVERYTECNILLQGCADWSSWLVKLKFIINIKIKCSPASCKISSAEGSPLVPLTSGLFLSEASMASCSAISRRRSSKEGMRRVRSVSLFNECTRKKVKANIREKRWEKRWEEHNKKKEERWFSEVWEELVDGE